jgi:Short C-terminal domain
MFGHKWEPGRATIVAVKEVKTIGNDYRTGTKLQGFEYVADVQPDSGSSPFRIVMGDPFDETHWDTPRVGEVLAVKCDPQRQKAKFDTSGLKSRDEASARAAVDEQAAQFAAALHQPPGSTAVSPLAQPQSALPDGSRAAARLLPLSDTIAAIQRARAAGDLAEVARIKAEFQGRAVHGDEAPQQSAASPDRGESDVVDLLTKLADLHSRGVLTDSEFAAEKAKILAQDSA